MTTEDLFQLVRDAMRRIDAQQPITQEMGEALLQYCASLEVALAHVRDQNAELRKELVLDRMLKPAGRQFLQ